MIELVVVLIMLGVLSAIAIPRMTGLSDYRARAFRDDVSSALRYAQKTAVSHRRAVCVAFSTYTVALSIVGTTGSTDCSTAVALPLANGEPGVFSPDATIGFSLDVPAFDASTLNFTFLPSGDGANRVILVGDQPAITVVGATGYVS